MSTSELQLDTDILKDQGKDVYSSLTDLNEIPVFTPDFAKKVNAVKKQEQEQATRINRHIFVGDMEPVNTDRQIIAVLFQEETLQVVEEKELAEAAAIAPPMYFFLGMVFLCFLGFMIVYISKRKQTRRVQAQDIAAYAEALQR